VTRPMSKSELLALPPVMTLAALGRALGVSEPTIRERHRKGELAELGIRVLRLGAQYRVPTADVLNLLGISATGEAADESDIGAAQGEPAATPRLRAVRQPGSTAQYAMADQEPP
jgi:hypothetical protein